MKTKTKGSILVVLGLALMLAGCSQKQNESEKAPGAAALKPEAAHTDTPSAPRSDAGLKFAAPADWIVEKPSSGSRQAQYRLPRAAGDTEDAELVIYYFNGGGGTPQANVERWVSQFTGVDGKPVADAKITHKTVDNIPLTVVDVSGTYSSSMGMMQQGGPKKGMRLLGAIAEAGNGPWFMKLTGPERTVAKWKPSFEAFLESIRPSE